jgi:hypothetical protein
MTGGEISGNTVRSLVDGARGGGFYANKGTFTMNAGAVILGNTVTGTIGYGGGVYANINSTLVINGNAGGDAYAGGVSIDTTAMTMNSGTAVSGNYAVGNANAYGGGIRQAGGTVEMKGGVIGGNKADAATTAQGGGVHQYSGTFTKTGGAIYGSAEPDTSLKNTAKLGATYYRASGTGPIAGISSEVTFQ